MDDPIIACDVFYEPSAAPAVIELFDATLAVRNGNRLLLLLPLLFML